MPGHLVVQRAARRVRGVRLPVHTLAAGILRDVINAIDERAPDAMAALVRNGEEILQVAQQLEARRAAMVDVVAEPEDPALTFGDDAVDGFVGVEEAAPGGVRHLIGQCGGADALIESVVFVPEGLPGIEIVGSNGADVWWRAFLHHRDGSLLRNLAVEFTESTPPAHTGNSRASFIMAL